MSELTYQLSQYYYSLEILLSHRPTLEEPLPQCFVTVVKLARLQRGGAAIIAPVQ